MDDIEIIHGDALTQMAEFPDASFAAIVTDPPYWTLDIHRSTGTTTRLGGGGKGDSDPDKFFETIDHDYLVKSIMEFDRLLPKNGHAWIMCDHLTQVFILGFVREAGRRAQGGTDFTYSKLYPVLKMSEDGKSYRPGMGYHGRAVTEYVVLLEKGRRKFSDNNWPDVFAFPWLGAKQSRNYTPDSKPYPTAKPLAFYKRLVELSTSPDERVLDPFAGSGGCGAAARLTGRCATLIDKSERSCKTMMARLYEKGAVMPEKTLEDLVLFDNEQMQEMITLDLQAPPASILDAQPLTVPCFNDTQAAEARGYADRTNGSLYTWKSDGLQNWLVEGDASLVDFFCFVVLPTFMGPSVDLMDDEITEIEPEE